MDATEVQSRPAEHLEGHARDSCLYRHLTAPDVAASLFERVAQEVKWHDMIHKTGPVPRRVGIQTDMTDGVKPVYRHPVDSEPPNQPWTPTILKIRQLINELAGVDCNHCLIQHYRSGEDFIGEHADKTVDIAQNSKVFNFSIGATRTMILRTKRDVPRNSAGQRHPLRIPLCHNSLFCLGWETNRRMTHEIKRDRRMERDKQPDEVAYGGERISLTFRRAVTFMRLADAALFGQGSKIKSAAMLPPLPEEQQDRVAREGSQGGWEVSAPLLHAFGRENNTSSYQWSDLYGEFA